MRLVSAPANHLATSAGINEHPVSETGLAAIDTRKHLPTDGIFRILVCRVTHSLGNTLLLTPLIRELALRYPGAEISIVTRSPVATDVFGFFPNIRKIIILPSHGIFHPFEFLACLREMRAQTYDLVIDPCSRSVTGRLLTALAKAPFKTGFIKSRTPGGVTHPIEIQRAVKHTGQRPVALLRCALGEKPCSKFPALSIELSYAERAAGLALLNRLLQKFHPRHTVVVGIFANATGAKLLPAEWWHQFIDAFVAKHPHSVVVEIIPAFARSILNHRFPCFYSSDIRRLASVLSGLSLFISADCGVMHLACAAGTPVAAIFSVTDPDEWGPYTSQDLVLDARLYSPKELAASINLLPSRV